MISKIVRGSTTDSDSRLEKLQVKVAEDIMMAEDDERLSGLTF
jgi:hypothetical protein